MKKEFIEEISRSLDIKEKGLIEKDLILHQMLIDLSKDKFFSENFLFKGGTCLTKNYMGYFRFSEDIDFTWKNQSIFKDLSMKKLRAVLSKDLNKIGEIIEKIAAKRGFEFKSDKTNRDYVKIGSSNKMVTFKVWYNSEITNTKTFFIIQINFLDLILFDTKKGKLKSLLEKNDKTKRIELLYPEFFKEYSSPVSFEVYDIKEIICEKIRAILTRKGIKGRDFLDVYLISKEFSINLDDVKDKIIKKLIFILDKYERYRDNLEAKEKTNAFSGNFFKWGEEKNLLLKEIDEKDFYAFLDKFSEFLSKILNELKEKDKKGERSE